MTEDMSNCPTEIRHAWEERLSAMCPLEGAVKDESRNMDPYSLALIWNHEKDGHYFLVDSAKHKRKM